MNNSTQHHTADNEDDNCLAHFSEKGSEWSHLYKRPAFADRLNLFTELPAAKLPPGSHILDFGCGSGVISFGLVERGFDVTGVDGAEGMIEAAKANNRTLGHTNVKFLTIDPLQPDVGQNLYDAVVCSSVIEYLPDDQSALSQFAAALKPGGWLFVSVPNQSSLVGKLEDRLRKSKNKNGNGLDVHYCQRRYDKQEFLNRLAELGFQHFETKYFEFPKLGKPGVLLSRLSHLGVMMIVAAQKTG